VSYSLALVSLLPNTDRLQQFEDFCQSFFYFYQILTAFNNLKIFVRGCSTSTKYWPPSTIWRFLSELFLLLPNTDRLQQFEDFCQSFFYFYQILTAFNNLKIFVRACSTSTKYWPPSTIWRFLSELVLLLPMKLHALSCCDTPHSLYISWCVVKYYIIVGLKVVERHKGV
jgi:hypothetical protein